MNDRMHREPGDEGANRELNSSEAMRYLVQALPDDAVGDTWRMQLDARLQAVKAHPVQVLLGQLSDEPVTSTWRSQLDMKLVAAAQSLQPEESFVQRTVAAMVHDLEEEAVPVHWRSDLNAKLAAMAPAPQAVPAAVVAHLISQLPEEQVSLAWRARLNERIRQHATKARKITLGFLWKPMAGMAVAATLTFMILIQFRHTQKESDIAMANGTSVEATLVRAHEEGLNSVTVVGQGATPHELQLTASKTSRRAVGADWSEVDLEPL